MNQCAVDASHEEFDGSTWNGTTPEHGDMHVVKASTEEPTKSHMRATCDHACRKHQQRCVHLAVPFNRAIALGIRSASSLVCGHLLPMLLLCGIMKTWTLLSKGCVFIDTGSLLPHVWVSRCASVSHINGKSCLPDVREVDVQWRPAGGLSTRLPPLYYQYPASNYQ